MASALTKQRDYKYIAEKYSELNELQMEHGKKLVNLLSLKRGDKVLDMGCGTGEITSLIADQVGEEGEVLGVDPDEERIKVAAQPNRFGTKRNMKFVVGDSSSNFPRYNEEYYDVFYSNLVFHWLTAPEKAIFLKTAFSCLKPGGIIGILSTDKPPEVMNKVAELLPDDEIENNRPPAHYVEKSVAESMMGKSGFVIRLSEYAEDEFVAPSLETFLT